MVPAPVLKARVALVQSVAVPVQAVAMTASLPEFHEPRPAQYRVINLSNPALTSMKSV